MYLHHYILIAASVLSICFSESTSNHATSSQSYDSGDVSFTYKNNLITLYTTSKPHSYLVQNSNQIHIRALPQKQQHVNYENIQYAPFLSRPSQQNLDSPKESQKSEVNTEMYTTPYENQSNDDEDSQQRQEQKRNLIPHVVVTESSNDRLRNYVPGYNVDLQAVNKKLMQHGIYASNPNFLVKNKQVNVNYLQPQDIQEVPKTVDVKIKGIYSVLTHAQEAKQYNGDIVSGGQKTKRPFFYVKAPTMELNLARTRHIARTIHKAPVNFNSNFRKLPSLPHEFFSNPNIVQPSKSQLHPIRNRNVYIVRRSV